MREQRSKNYFERRAVEERVAADQAHDELAAQSHRELSEHYRKIAAGTEKAPGDGEEVIGDGILRKDFQIVP